MGVHGSHAEPMSHAIDCLRGVSHQFVADERVDVGVLQNCCKGMPQGLGSCNVAKADLFHDGDELLADHVAVNCARIAPNRVGSLQTVGTR
jgi:hypothetical protein